MWEKRGPRGTRPVLSSTGMWCSPSITTASGRPERPCFFDTNSFGFSAAESIYTRSPWTAYRSRVVRAAWSEPIERYRKNEAPISQRRASATKPWARLWFTTPVSETAAVAITAAAIAKPRITRSDRSFSASVTSVSARYRKYTAARSQISAIAPSVYETWRLSDERNFTPTIATIDAAIAKYKTPASASRAFASWASMPFRSADAASCAFSPSASSGPSSGARPRLSHQLSGQYPNFSMSAAEMSSEGGTRSHPRAGLYVFVSCSQFPEGDGGRDGDEGVQRNERGGVLEPPRIDAGRRPSLPVRVERGLEDPRQIGIFHDEADLAILGRRTERPVHARDEDGTAVHDRAFVVKAFDWAPWREESDLEGETPATVSSPTPAPQSNPVVSDRSPPRRHFAGWQRVPRRRQSRTNRGCPLGPEGIPRSRSSPSRSTPPARRRSRTSRGGSDTASRHRERPRAIGRRRRPPTDRSRPGVRPLPRLRPVSRPGGPGPSRRVRPRLRGRTRSARSGRCRRPPRSSRERTRAASATGGLRHRATGPRSSALGARSGRGQMRIDPDDGAAALPNPSPRLDPSSSRSCLEPEPRFPRGPSVRPRDRSIPGPCTTSLPTHRRPPPCRSGRRGRSRPRHPRAATRRLPADARRPPERKSPRPRGCPRHSSKHFAWRGCVLSRAGASPAGTSPSLRRP